MTAADRPSVTPRTGDTITTAEQLDALPVGSIFLSPFDAVWRRVEESESQGGYRFESIEYDGRHQAETFARFSEFPLTVLYVPGEPSRPSVTDNARAEAERRYGTPRESDLLPSDYVTIGQIEGYVEGRLAAALAETTTALPRPGDGCQCTWHNEDRGGGHYELVAEYEPACPEHSEHVWNPRTGMWEHRADTTTATIEDKSVIERAATVITANTDEPMWSAVVIAKEMAARGLLATARTRPTRQQVITTLREHDPDNHGGWHHPADHYYEAQADAVLALLEGGDDR